MPTKIQILKMLFESPLAVLLVSSSLSVLNKLLVRGAYYNYMRVILSSYRKLCFKFQRQLIYHTIHRKVRTNQVTSWIYKYCGWNTLLNRFLCSLKKFHFHESSFCLIHKENVMFLATHLSHRQNWSEENLASLEEVIEELILDKQAKRAKLSESQNKGKF